LGVNPSTLSRQLPQDLKHPDGVDPEEAERFRAENVRPRVGAAAGMPENYGKAKTALAVAEAQLAALRLRERQGDLIDRSKAIAVGEDILRRHLHRLRMNNRDYARRLAGVKDVREISRLLDDWIATAFGRAGAEFDELLKKK
jgi:hypothetical protein